MKDLQKSTGFDGDEPFDSDELDLVPEALKDLTVAMGRARHVRGGATTKDLEGCEAGTM